MDQNTSRYTSNGKFHYCSLYLGNLTGFLFHSNSLGRHSSTTAEVSEADCESTLASSESTGTQIPVTGSSTRSDSVTWPV